MLRALTLTTCLLGTVPALAAEVLSIEDYLAISRGDSTAMTNTELDHYLAGVLDGVISLGDVAQTQGNPVFCLPDNPTQRITVNNFREALDEMLAQLEQQLDDFADRAQRSTMGRAGIQLFLLRFPCEEASGG